MILSLAAVSVLVGSLLYMNLVLAGKPEPQPSIIKDSVKIDVLGWVTRQYTGNQAYPKEYGIIVTWSYPADLAFIFQPHQSDFNVTSIYVVLYATDAADDFVLNINGAGITEIQLRLPINDVQAKRYQLDTSVVQINEGINLLSMSSSSGPTLSVYEIEVFIEYEYQAWQRNTKRHSLIQSNLVQALVFSHSACILFLYE